MATTTFQMTNSATTDAEFRAKVTAVISAITAVGLVQTTDTGQIDPATVLKPSAVTTSAGFAMFRFSDTLQATKPVFIKVLFCTGSSVNTVFSLQLQVGVATDGAGGFVGISTASLWVNLGSVAMATSFTQYMSGANNRFGCFFSPNQTNVACSVGMFHIERTKDVNGNDTAEGVIGYWNSLTNANISQCLNFNSGQQPGTHPPFALIPHGASATSTLFGSDVGMFHFYGYLGGKLSLPCLNLLAYLYGDHPANNVFSVVHYGASRTFLAWGSVFPSANSNGAARGDAGVSTNSRWAMRWE